MDQAHSAALSRVGVLRPRQLQGGDDRERARALADLDTRATRSTAGAGSGGEVPGRPGDFRAIRSGRQVFLCWQTGELEITHWHELDAGFSGRRGIADPGEFKPAYVS